jgi:PAS domain-containing protein
VQGRLQPPAEWAWFCGRCAATAPAGKPPPPTSRVCRSCGLGLLLETPLDCVPSSRDAFLVLDSALAVQAVSRAAERLLGIGEELAVDRPVGEMLAPAAAEDHGHGRFAAAVTEAIAGGGAPIDVFVRPANTFGVRMRARIAPCGPPPAALIVLEPRAGGLRVARGREN